MQRICRLLGTIAVLVLAVMLGMILDRARSPRTTVHAQEGMNMGSSTCVATVPSAWGDFKGGSSYGLAFQDSQGRLRFVLNPPCGGTMSTQEAPSAYVALEIQRK